MYKLIRTVVKNYSQYPRDIVWENAQDLEHVVFLHRDTNYDFNLLHVVSEPGSKFEYTTLIYRAKRKIFLMPIQSFGFRRIVSNYNIHQVEWIPLLGVKSALNSLLFETNEIKRPTLMVDEIILEVPEWLHPFRSWICKALQRHANTQCVQDECFRERRAILKSRGIHMPFKIFNESTFSKLTSQFKIDGSQAFDPNSVPTSQEWKSFDLSAN